jgi:hypothetical protein
MKHVILILLFSVSLVYAEGWGISARSLQRNDIERLQPLALLRQCISQHKDTFIVTTAAMMLTKLLMFKKDSERQNRFDIFSSTGVVISLVMLFDERYKSD